MRLTAIKTGIAFAAVFMGGYIYLNLGRSYNSMAADKTMTVVADGNWTSPEIWSGGRLPQDNDTLVVPAGKTLTVDVVTTRYVHLYIKVYGTIHLNGGKKIVMCDGKIDVYAGGLLVGENNGSKINICDVMVWSGNDPGAGPLSFGELTAPFQSRITSFNATIAGHTVTLQWDAEHETSNNYFTIERSADSINFQSLENVPGTGDGSSVQHYTHTDENPVKGNNYYRIKLTASNGMSVYSVIQNVKFAAKGQVQANDESKIQSIGPSPFSDSFTINYFAKTDGSANMQIANASGFIVAQKSFTAVKGMNTFSFNKGANLNTGIYYVKVEMNGKVDTKRVIKG
jgi:hypothetical protein